MIPILRSFVVPGIFFRPLLFLPPPNSMPRSLPTSPATRWFSHLASTRISLCFRGNSRTRLSARIRPAYRLRIATSPAILKSGKPDVWDSGVVKSDQSVGVKYAGVAAQAAAALLLAG